MELVTFVIVVHGSAESSQSHQSAQDFIGAALELGYTIDRVFFYGDATSITMGSDNSQTSNQTHQKSWLKLSQQFQIPLQACISTAIRRGIVDPQQAEENHKAVNLADGFSLEGLGALAESIHSEYRIIEFGA